MTWELNTDAFLATLSELVALGPNLQNAPDVGLIPVERLAVEVVEARLRPHEASGFLRLQRIADDPERPNLVVTVRGLGSGSLGFVGAHFDVVPADRQAEGWLTDPFTCVVEPDGTLRGRGVTDCLGHVALLTELLVALAERGQSPERSLTVVFISNEEETSIPGIGLEAVADAGALEPLRDGPLYWVDSADVGPTLGTGGIATWTLEVTGVGGHSGMPHNCVNALELAAKVSELLADWFRTAYPPHPSEAVWGYESPSSLKPTLLECDNRKITKIPGTARIEGDLRLTPFYDLDEAIAGAASFVAALDVRLQSEAQLAGFSRTRTASGQAGSVRFIAGARRTPGIACHLDSPGLAQLKSAIVAVSGPDALRPFSMTGSLPLVRALQERGFDVQITGFGESRSYHAPNEKGQLSDFRAGYAMLGALIDWTSIPTNRGVG